MRIPALTITAALLLIGSCTEPRLGVRVPFVATWDGTAIDCDSAEPALSDLRFFVSDIALLDGQRRPHNLELDAQYAWQQEDLALIDLEDGRGRCTNGSSEVFAYLVGYLPEREYEGLEFTIGVPFERNHANPLTADAPLDNAAMHWHWRSGYKFLRAGVSTASDGFWIHVGSAGCEGTVQNVTGCSFPNRVRVSLPRFTPRASQVEIDLAALLEGTNLDDGLQSDCSSGPPESSCIAPFAALGIDFESGRTVGPQSVFSVRE